MPNCVVKGCKNHSSKTKKQDGITFHTFPVRYINVKEKWIEVIRDSRNEPSWNPTVRSVVCSTHFENDDLYYTKNGLRRVLRNGYPKHLPAAPDQSANIDLNEPPSVYYAHVPATPIESIDVDPIRPHTLQAHGSTIPVLSTTSVICNMEEERESLLDTPKKRQLRQRIFLLENQRTQMKKKIKTLNQKVRRLKKKQWPSGSADKSENLNNYLYNHSISQSVISLEQPKMCNLLSSIKTEDYGLNEDITETAPVSTLFCICCLKKGVPFVSLLTCLHADFLNSFMMPEIKLQNQVICYDCHEKMKKIKLFKLQVEESFKLLSDISTENTPKRSNQNHNLKIHQVFKIDIPHTNFNNIENPQTILEDAKINLNDIIKEEKEIFDNTEKSPPPKSLQNKNMKNIEEAIRIIHNNQNSDCISLLANSLQSISHSLLSDIHTNFELGGQNDRNPTELLINVNTASTTAVNPTENITNDVLNENLNTIEKGENINEEEIDRIVPENVDTVENVNEELDQAVIKKEFIDVGESNDMQTQDTSVPFTLDKRLTLGSNIKQLTLTREQLMQERKKIATSQSYLRAPHRCESCLIGFQFQENLEDHVKRKHTSGKRHTTECDVCLQHVDQGAINMHTFWHQTRYECVACAETFASYDKAALHYRKNHHRGRSSVFFKCPHCPYKTGRKSWFTEHLKAYTKCKLCGVIIRCAAGSKLKVHMRHCVGAKLKTVSKSKKPKVTSTTGPVSKNVQRII